MPEAPKGMLFSTLRGPLEAMWQTRTARATHAAVDLCSFLDGDKNFAFITLAYDEANSGGALSMSWWLSNNVRRYIDEQLDLKRPGVNTQALNTIESWRALPPGRN